MAGHRRMRRPKARQAAFRPSPGDHKTEDHRSKRHQRDSSASLSPKRLAYRSTRPLLYPEHLHTRPPADRSRQTETSRMRIIDRKIGNYPQRHKGLAAEHRRREFIKM